MTDFWIPFIMVVFTVSFLSWGIVTTSPWNLLPYAMGAACNAYAIMSVIERPGRGT